MPSLATRTGLPKESKTRVFDSRVFLENVIENVPDPMYVKDRDHRWVLVNQAFCRYLGKAREQVLGKTDADVYDSLLAAVMWEHDQNVFVRGVEELAEVSVPLPGGPPREFAVRRNLYRDREGHAFVVGLMRDVTERNIALRSLREREALLEEAQALANVGNMFWDARTSSLVWSKQLYKIYGLDPLTAPPASEAQRFMLMAGEWEKAGDHLRRAFEAGSPSTFEYRIRRPDGSVRTLVANVQWRRDAVGDLIGLAGTVQDVTDQMAAAAALRKSESLHRMIAENVGDGIWIVELSSLRFVYASPAVINTSGYTPEELSNLTIDQVVAPSSLERVQTELKRALAEANSGLDVTHRLEIEEKSKAGGTVWVEVTARLLRDAEGIPREILGVTREITERRRSRELLERAKAQAEEASRLKSRFVSNVSHEIRTPLNAIIGFSELVLGDTVLSEAQARARVILRESEVLLALVNELLDHAKMEEGKLELCPEPSDLRELLATLERSGGLQAVRKGLDFQLVVAPDVPSNVNCDALRLRQVLQNLINNALKFTERGSVSVEVVCLERSSRRATVKFTVNDTGIGIPEDRQTAIFDSFVQADAQTTRKYGGTGLGTTIARQLVEMMGGRLELESHFGYGSTFWFAVPFDIVEFDSLAPISSAARALEDGEAPRHHGAILVAEDYPVNHRILREHLEGAGHSVTVVETGSDAVRACSERQFDLVLMDLQMPIMDGLEATRQIRALPGPAARVPIYGVTASAEASTRRECVIHGMTGVMTKPIRRAALLDTVETCLARLAGGSPSVRVEPPKLVCPCMEEALRKGGQTQALSPIDAKGLVEQFGGKEELAWSVAREFVAGLDQELAFLRSSAQAGDLDQVRRRAHRIKGGASSLCANRVADLAGCLELAAASTRTQEVEVLMPELERAYQSLSAAVAESNVEGKESE